MEQANTLSSEGTTATPAGTPEIPGGVEGWPGQGFATAAAIGFALTSLIAFGPFGPGDGRAAPAPAIASRSGPLVENEPNPVAGQEEPFTPPVNLAPAGPSVEDVGRFQVESYFPLQPLTVRDRTRLRALPQSGDGVEAAGVIEAGGRLMVNGRVEVDGDIWFRVRLADRRTAFIREDQTINRQAWQRQQTAARAAAAAAAATSTEAISPDVAPLSPPTEPDPPEQTP